MDFPYQLLIYEVDCTTIVADLDSRWDVAFCGLDETIGDTSDS